MKGAFKKYAAMEIVMSTTVSMTNEELMTLPKDGREGAPTLAGSSMTDAELMQLPENGYKYEYVDGELIMSPAGLIQEKVGTRLIYLISSYLEDNPVAEILGSNAGYRMLSGNVRSPDVSVIRLERLPGGEVPEGFGYFAPDLAVEVLSPNQSAAQLREKIEEYFANGTQTVWVINEKTRTIMVHRSPKDFQTFGESDTLEGSPVLPGFSCNVGEIFKKRKRR
jgi:Uma2 family endonuclease